MIVFELFHGRVISVVDNKLNQLFYRLILTLFQTGPGFYVFAVQAFLKH